MEYWRCHPVLMPDGSASIIARKPVNLYGSGKLHDGGLSTLRRLSAIVRVETHARNEMRPENRIVKVWDGASGFLGEVGEPGLDR